MTKLAAGYRKQRSQVRSDSLNLLSALRGVCALQAQELLKRAHTGLYSQEICNLASALNEIAQAEARWLKQTTP